MSSYEEPFVRKRRKPVTEIMPRVTRDCGEALIMRRRKGKERREITIRMKAKFFIFFFILCSRLMGLIEHNLLVFQASLIQH